MRVDDTANIGSVSPLQTGCRVCPPTSCTSVFVRVFVQYRHAGGTRISWFLRNDFLSPRPHVFQVQFAERPSINDCDWINVGDPTTNVHTASDAVKRTTGTNDYGVYRVKLTTDDGVFYSDAVSPMDTLQPRDWRHANEILRQYRRHLRDGGARGVLLRSRTSGSRCRTCDDPELNSPARDNCVECHGTGYSGGYLYPIDCVYADLAPVSYKTDQTDVALEKLVETRGVMVNTSLLERDDVWINLATDDRWFVRAVETVVSIRGVSLVANVLLRQVPRSSRLYELVIPYPQELLRGYESY
jgi:hypothetical protein